MPTYPHIESYYTELNDLIQFGDSDNELSIRKAFQDCLSEYCSNHRENLKLIPELAAAGGIPDGTVKDSLRLARGYWEAKDTHDDLDAEIQRKFNRGYPRDNIVFEDSQTAVLFKNEEEATLTRPLRRSERGAESKLQLHMPGAYGDPAIQWHCDATSKMS